MTSFRRSIPTIDRISDLPDSILCHILSLLPTKEATTTSILSKRWKQVWLSLLTLYFDDKTFNDFNSFRKFVYSTMFKLRDKRTSFHSFTLKCGRYSPFKPRDFNRILEFVMQRGVVNLDFDMSNKLRCIKLPPCVLSCKTLRVLELAQVKIGDFDQVDFPLVEAIFLKRICFISLEYVVKFLLGFPSLKHLYIRLSVSKKSPITMEDVNGLPNLVKARICERNTPMALFGKTKILHIDTLTFGSTRFPECYNLSNMEVSIHHDSVCDKKCTWLLEILPYFPKLRYFMIQEYCNISGRARAI